MPSSRPNTIPTVVHLLRQLKPQSILDVGVGFGKWGHLFREYTDIIEAEHDPARYQRKNWRIRIDGIEGHPAVRVGLDEDAALSSCSLVSFPLPGERRGAVGVLGPLRMDYARVFSIVDAVGRRVAELI